jgi:hypothetical protein
MFLACKEFHLASKMLLSKALWQLVTILRTCFSSLNTRRVREKEREMIRGFQNCEPKGKNALLLPPALNEANPVTFSKTSLSRVRSRSRETSGQQLDR